MEYYVGIDLGTSRTSIATSTGKRLTKVTCVGYAKDIVARKRLGQEYLLGEEALKNRLALNMVWPLEDGVIVENDKPSLEATGLILRDIVAEAIPGKEKKDKIYAAIGVPSQASIKSKKLIVDLTKDFIDKILIVSEPFAVAYSLDKFDESLIVDIGGGTADLARIHGTIPEAEDQISLTTAGNFLDGEISKEILKKYKKVQVTPQIIRRIKEKYGYVDESAEQIIVTLTEKGIPDKFDITDILKKCCLRLTEPICAAVNTLVGDFDPEFQEKMRNNVIVAGGGSRLKGIDRAIEKGLIPYGGGEATCVQDSEFCGALGALKLSLEMPDDYWEKIK